MKVPQGIPAYTTPLKLDKAFAIPGWMLPIELLFLAEQAAKHSRIVEIGSYLGRSTRALADNTPGWVVAVDDWFGPRDAEHEQNLYEKFIDNMKGVRHIVSSLHFDHNEVDPVKIVDSFDMIFIDGDHSYESVKRDIAKWLPYLEKGGLICGHDFSPEYEGVRRAVTEAFEGQQLAVTGTIWAVIPDA